MKTLCGMMLVGLGSLGLLLACDGGSDPATDGGTDAAVEDGGQDAGEDAGGGDEGAQYWGECPFPCTAPRGHMLEDEMGMELEVFDVHLRCQVRYEDLDAEVFIKARPIGAANFSFQYELEHAYVCRDGQVQEVDASLALFAWRHHSWKDLEIVIDEHRFVWDYSETCVGARPCTPWPDQFDVRLQADSSLVAEAQPSLCAGVGVTGLPVPFVEQRRIPAEGSNIPFTMGSESGDADEAPEVTFQVWNNHMDVRECSNADFALFLNDQGNDCEGNVCADLDADEFHIHQVDGRYVADEGYEDVPVVRVSWYGADAFCKWRRMLLPYESTWEMAASAMGTRNYPWGDEAPSFAHALYADCNVSAPEAVCSRPAGDSREGLCNLAGNVSEWMDTWYDAELYATCVEDQTCSRGPWADTGAKSVRGGSFATGADSLRATDRNSAPPESMAADRGFRCMAGNPSF